MADLSSTAQDLVNALCQRRYPASAGPCVKPCEECREDVAFLLRALVKQEFPQEAFSSTHDYAKGLPSNDEFALETLTEAAEIFKRHQRQHTRRKLINITTELDPDIQLDDCRSSH